LGLEYTIEYRKGVTNRVADALFRRVSPKETEFDSLISQLVPEWLNEVQHSYVNDQLAQQIRDKLEEGKEQLEWKEVRRLLKKKGKIYVGTSGTTRHKLINEVHGTAIGGHSGILATYQRLKRYIFWPNMKHDIYNFVKECEVCQINKGEIVLTPNLLQPLPIPTSIWSHITMDFIEKLPKSEGKDTILVVVDKLTKYAYFLPLAHPFSAPQVVKLFINNVHKLHEVPKYIVSDRDKIFTSEFWKELSKKLGTTLHFSTAYHPQTDGQTERVNQCLECYLRCMCFEMPKKMGKLVIIS
jgi:Integrase zinc binding domain/Integrase core domain